MSLADLLRKALRKPALKASSLFASNPDPEMVAKELDKLYHASLNQTKARNKTTTISISPAQS